MSTPTTLTATVASPCIGSQSLSNFGPNAWGGAAGDFTYAAVGLNAAQTGFILVVTQLDVSSACFPSRTFDQDVPNATDPTGQYGSGSASVIDP
ncbi:MAG: hypothetical protein AAGI54_04060 [Planctomycetota bacterium]